MKEYEVVDNMGNWMTVDEEWLEGVERLDEAVWMQFNRLPHEELEVRYKNGETVYYVPNSSGEWYVAYNFV